MEQIKKWWWGEEDEAQARGGGERPSYKELDFTCRCWGATGRQGTSSACSSCCEGRAGGNEATVWLQARAGDC